VSLSAASGLRSAQDLAGGGPSIGGVGCGISLSGKAIAEAIAAYHVSRSRRALRLP
jgi:hypothetical protein